jgi:hypothetical protein
LPDCSRPRWPWRPRTAAPRSPEPLTLRFASKNRAPAALADTPGEEAGSFCGRHAAGLYQQALLTLGDEDLAEHVVMSVIVDECIRSGAAGGSARGAARRLAVSTYWRCQEMAGRPAERSRPAVRLAPAGPPGRGGAGALSVRERGALGLVLFGGLRCAEASRELAMPARDLAAILHALTARVTLMNSPPEGEQK